MKLLNSHLRRIIKEEAIKVLSKSDEDLSTYSYEELEQMLSHITMRMSRMEKDMTSMDDRMIATLQRGDAILGKAPIAR
jgi:prefoldin subunit 5